MLIYISIKSFGNGVSPNLAFANIKPQNIETYCLPNSPAWCLKFFLIYTLDKNKILVNGFKIYKLVIRINKFILIGQKKT